MTVSFRNVHVDPDAGPDDWPFEALLTAVERGALSDWRRLASAIRENPWGPCARAVDTISSWAENEGVDALLTQAIADARAEADMSYRRSFGARIRSVRESLGLTQREFAPMIGTSASRLASYESGKVAPSVVMLGRLERAAVCSPSPGPRPVPGGNSEATLSANYK